MNNDWNVFIENICQDIGNKSMGYKWMHYNTALGLSSIASKLKLFGTLMGPLVGISIFSNTGDILVLKIVTGVISFVIGISTAMLQTNNYDEEASKHKLASGRYSSLISNIRRQLSIPYEKREKGDDYVKWIEKNYNDLVTNSPDIDDLIVTKYIKLATQKNIPIPDSFEIAGIINQNINTDSVGMTLRRLSDVSIDVQPNVSVSHSPVPHADVGDINESVSNISTLDENETKMDVLHSNTPTCETMNDSIYGFHFTDEQMKYEVQRYQNSDG
jgi:hypothetical protein